MRAPGAYAVHEARSLFRGMRGWRGEACSAVKPLVMPAFRVPALYTTLQHARVEHTRAPEHVPRLSPRPVASRSSPRAHPSATQDPSKTIAAMGVSGSSHSTTRALVLFAAMVPAMMGNKPAGQPPPSPDLQVPVAMMADEPGPLAHEAPPSKGRARAGVATTSSWRVLANLHRKANGTSQGLLRGNGIRDGEQHARGQNAGYAMHRATNKTSNAKRHAFMHRKANSTSQRAHGELHAARTMRGRRRGGANRTMGSGPPPAGRKPDEPVSAAQAFVTLALMAFSLVMGVACLGLLSMFLNAMHPSTGTAATQTDGS